MIRTRYGWCADGHLGGEDMGEAAKKDGSMEDILASIRRIISAESEDKKPEVRTDALTPRSVETPRSILHNDVQLPRTGSLSALAQQVRAERQSPSISAALDAPVSRPAPGVVVTPKASSLSELGQQFRSQDATGPTGADSSANKIETPALNEPVKAEVPAAIGEPENATPSAEMDKSAEVSAKTLAPGLSLKDLAEKVAVAAAPPKAPDQPKSNQSGFASAIAAAAESEALQDTPKPRAQAVTQDRRESSSGPETATEVKISKAEAEVTNRSVGAFREALVSPSTQAAITNSMDRLRQSVEDINAAHVENILRPMLKTWLDENLPDMVERMVQQEISRITSKK